MQEFRSRTRGELLPGGQIVRRYCPPLARMRVTKSLGVHRPHGSVDSLVAEFFPFFPFAVGVEIVEFSPGLKGCRYLGYRQKLLPQRVVRNVYLRALQRSRLFNYSG